MSLTVTSISLSDFRNYEAFDLALSPEITVLVGPNAIGKTNVVEALELVTEAESFRRPAAAELVRWGATGASIRMWASGDGRTLEVRMDVSSEGRRLYQVNGKAKKARSQVVGAIPCVIFTPDDLGLVKNSASVRRDAVDDVGVQLSSTYGRLRAEYERTLRQRNKLLKDEMTDNDTLGAWTDRLVSLGASFGSARRRLFEKIAVEMGELYTAIAGGETLEATYLASWQREADDFEGSDEQCLRSYLQRTQQQERARMTTLAGPHRDEISFAVNGNEARAYASQGQQRTIALAFKLAEVRVMAGVSGQRPLLLLDDVMSELDEPRRHALASFVGTEAQTVITTTNLGYFEPTLLDRSAVVELR